MTFAEILFKYEGFVKLYSICSTYMDLAGQNSFHPVVPSVCLACVSTVKYIFLVPPVLRQCCFYFTWCIHIVNQIIHCLWRLGRGKASWQEYNMDSTKMMLSSNKLRKKWIKWYGNTSCIAKDNSLASDREYFLLQIHVAQICCILSI